MMSLSWFTPSAELTGPIVVTEFPAVVCTLYVLVVVDAVPQELLVVVVVESPKPKRLNPLVWLDVETLSLPEFRIKELDEPTNLLLP